MGYKKANRHLTDEQFSKGTTIDGSRIDDAIEDIVDAHNDVSLGDMEAQWTPNTITCNWTPSRGSLLRFLPNPINALPRWGVNQNDIKTSDWFPFMVSQNTANEVFPADEQPSKGIQNQFRSKGYYNDPTLDAADELEGRGTNSSAITPQDINDSAGIFYQQGAAITDWDGDIAYSLAGNGSNPLQRKFFTMDIPLYFSNPIIITNISVFAAAEHPLGAYNSYIDTSTAPYTYRTIQTDGYKSTIVGSVNNLSPSYDAYMPTAATDDKFEDNQESVIAANDPDQLPATSGVELPGELYTITQRNAGDMTVQLSLDNSFLPEDKAINKVIFSKTQLGDAVCRFNRCRTTTNRLTGAGAPGVGLGYNNGAFYEDMEPRFHGGTTWGVWLKADDLNIPLPRDSRLHYQIIVKGFRPQQLFDWHIAISYMELLT